MRKVRIGAMVAVAAVACLLAVSPWARSQSAPKVDPDEAEKRRLDRESKIARRVADPGRSLGTSRRWPRSH